MREMLVDAQTQAGSEGRQHCFEYYILIDQMEVSGGYACESYGVKIGVPGGGPDWAAVPNITTSASRIDALMALLTRNFVTPTGLNDVIADWL
ncbi:MAG: DUF6514 family protein [Pseudoflavonifractor sp.]